MNDSYYVQQNQLCLESTKKEQVLIRKIAIYTYISYVYF